MAERLSAIGVPIFMADVKGDLAGLSQPGQRFAQARRAFEAHRRRSARIRRLSRSCSGTCSASRAIRCGRRCPISGPLLLARILNLNDTQAGRAHARLQDRRRQRPAAARPQGPARPARSMLGTTRSNSRPITATSRRRRSARSSAACSRSSSRAADKFLGEPMLNVDDLLQTVDGKGVINILAADQLMQSPKVYSTLLLWLLSELYERLPEVGDPRQAQARVLLRRGAPAVHRRAQAAAGQDRAGRAADPLQGRGRVSS